VLDLKGLPDGRVVVVGIGNTLKADDGAGVMVAERLRRRFPDLVFEAGQAPENYLAPVRRAEPAAVVLVDAADFGGDAGEIRTASEGDVDGLMMGTHAAPLSMFMKMLAHDTGADIRLVAVQARSTELGGDVSREVAASVDYLARELGGLLDGRVGR
jgi:hydrogenase 3 maturation protease